MNPAPDRTSDANPPMLPLATSDSSTGIVRVERGSRVPNLFLIGAQKGGSTLLADHLNQSPDITYFGKKEPNLFNMDSEESSREKIATMEIGIPPEKYLLDGSPNYTRYPEFPNSPMNIAAVAGTDSRLIYIIRNPVERLISNYFWSRERYGESYSLAEAIVRDRRYVTTGLYDEQISRYLEYFDRGQFYFVKFEQYITDPSRALVAILNWLEAAPPDSFNPAPEFVAATDKQNSREARFPALNRLVRSQRVLKKIALAILPPDMQSSVNRLLSRKVPRSTIDVATKRDILEEHFRESILRTQEMTGLDLGEWLSAYEPSATDVSA